MNENDKPKLIDWTKPLCLRCEAGLPEPERTKVRDLGPIDGGYFERAATLQKGKGCETVVVYTAAGWESKRSPSRYDIINVPEVPRMVEIRECYLIVSRTGEAHRIYGNILDAKAVVTILPPGNRIVRLPASLPVVG